MAVQRPGFKPNVQANIEGTKGDNTFVNVKADTTMRFRFLPPSRKDGMVFTRSTNHFKLKSEEGRGMALACLAEHGNDETGVDCYLCRLVKVLRKHGTAGEKKISDALKCNSRLNAQVLIAEKVSKGEWKYFGPKILGLPKTAAQGVSQILANQEMNDDDFFTDPEKGQDIFITRKGTGFDTKYTVDRSGDKVRLDDIFPEWADRFIEDIYDELGLSILTPAEQKQAVIRTFGDEIDWETLAEYGV